MIYSDTRVAIVIVTRNRIASLLNTLNQLCSLPEQPQVIVIDNGSSDSTIDNVRSYYPQVTAISLSENLGPAGRNIGVYHTKCPYVAFSDDDSWWAPGSLARVVDLFDRYPRLALIAAKIFVGREQKLDPTCKEMAMGKLPVFPDAPGFPILGFLACGSIVRRSAYLAVGGYEKRFGIGGEESMLAMDLAAKGWRLAYVENITAYHFPSSIRNYGNRRRYEVRNTLITAWLRRPLGIALSKTISFLKPALRDPYIRAGLLDTLTKIVWLLRLRQPIPKHVEIALRILEG